MIRDMCHAYNILWGWLGHSYTFFAILSWLNSQLTFSFPLDFPSFVSVKAGIYCQVEDEQWPSSWGYLLLEFHGCVYTSVLQNSWFCSFLWIFLFFWKMNVCNDVWTGLVSMFTCNSSHILQMMLHLCNPTENVFEKCITYSWSLLAA